jgi:bifunctional non-homologous end joining protein LigD
VRPGLERRLVITKATTLSFAGKIGTGFNTKMLLDLRAQLDRLEIHKPPFTKAIGLPRSKVGDSLRAHWVHPEIVAQVGFIQWTKHNKLRTQDFSAYATSSPARGCERMRDHGR